MESRPHGFHDEDALGLCGGEDLARFRGIEGECFLAQDVFSVSDCVEAVLSVEAVWGADVDYVDGRVGVNPLIVGIDCWFRRKGWQVFCEEGVAFLERGGADCLDAVRCGGRFARNGYVFREPGGDETRSLGAVNMVTRDLG